MSFDSPDLQFFFFFKFIENVNLYNYEERKILDMRDKFIRSFAYLKAWISQNFEVPNFI